MENEMINDTQRDLPVEDFCEPYEGKQKKECVDYFERWFEEAEDKRRSGEKDDLPS